MNTKTEKLSRIKKSCNIGKVISRILMIICIIGTLIGILALVGLFIKSEPLLKELGIATANESHNPAGGMENVDLEGESGPLAFLVQPMLNNSDLGTQLYIMCGFIIILCALGALVWYLFSQVFAVIQKEESPFADAVMSKMKINFALLTIMIFVSTGIIPALAAAFLFWCIYSIFDYGRLLQVESDETL